MWQAAATISPLSGISSLTSLLKPEAKIMYQLKDITSNFVDVATFCGANSLTVDSFYSYLRSLKSKGFFDYSIADFTFGWKGSDEQ